MEGRSTSDVEQVRAHTERLASALASGNMDLVAAYVAEDRAAQVIEVLEAIPGPIGGTETLLVAALPPDDPFHPEEAFLCVLLFTGPQGEILVRTRWKREETSTPSIVSAGIV